MLQVCGEVVVVAFATFSSIRRELTEIVVLDLAAWIIREFIVLVLEIDFSGNDCNRSDKSDIKKQLQIQWKLGLNLFYKKMLPAKFLMEF